MLSPSARLSVRCPASASSPVAHSRSPAMHNAALDALGLPAWRYQLLPVPPELLAETVRALPAAGFRGANVTIPHKEAALAIADTATPAAAAIGAANTLSFARDGTISADNTDAPGLLAALPEPPRGRTALILGAGGSARPPPTPCARPRRRRGGLEPDPERAEALAADLGVRAVTTPSTADLLVNCTAVGLHDADATLKDLPLGAEGQGDTRAWSTSSTGTVAPRSWRRRRRLGARWWMAWKFWSTRAR